MKKDILVWKYLWIYGVLEKYGLFFEVYYSVLCCIFGYIM